MIKIILTIFLAALPVGAQLRVSNQPELEEYLEQLIETTKIPGVVAMAVDKDGEIFEYAYGDRDVARGMEMRTDTIFRIASMTKPIAAAAVMMIVEEGKLSLDDPISKHIPEFAERGVIQDFDAADGSYSTRSPRGAVTIRQMLSHSSGLAYGFASDVVAQLSRQETPPDPMPLMYDPGTAWSYANGIGIVCTVLERIEGQGLDVFLEERIFGPLGMRDTGYIVPATKNDRVATTHRPGEDGSLIEAANPSSIRSGVSGDGGLHSTANDYARFIRMVLNGGVAPDGTRLLSERSIRIMGQNQLGEVKVSRQDEPQPNLARAFPLGAGRDGFGIGFQVTGQPRSPDMRAPGSLSWAGIFNTEFWIDPATGVGGILLMQYLPFYDTDAIDALNGFERRLYEGLVVSQGESRQ